MAVGYYRLWKLLTDKDIKKNLRVKSWVSPVANNKMGRGAWRNKSAAEFVLDLKERSKSKMYRIM